MARTIYVNCPKCKELLEVDASNGKVIQHFASKKKEGSEDLLGDTLQEIKEKDEQVDKIFNQVKDKSGKRLEEADKLFKEKAEDIKKKGDAEKPKNIFDLD